jgi:hypothetical protein
VVCKNHAIHAGRPRATDEADAARHDAGVFDADPAYDAGVSMRIPA